jgi:hypothetical protein
MVDKAYITAQKIISTDSMSIYSFSFKIIAQILIVIAKIEEQWVIGLQCVVFGNLSDSQFRETEFFVAQTE